MFALKRFVAVLSLSLACALAAGQVMAGAADVATSEGGRMKFEYADDGRLRINMQEADSYMLVRDGEIYAVSESNGSPQVISLLQAMNMFGGMADSATRTVMSPSPTWLASGVPDRRPVPGFNESQSWFVPDWTDHW